MRPLRVLLVVFALSLGLLAAESPFNGTWKLNVSKSKMSPPAPQSETVHVDADDNSIRLTDDLTDDDVTIVDVSETVADPPHHA